MFILLVLELLVEYRYRTISLAYQLYKLVEEDVRRATELERFIHENHGALDASQIAVDMFRVRQLTGLDELEKKYYSSS